MDDSPTLRGRGAESLHLTNLLKAVRGRHSQVLVLRGEAGIGKTALLMSLMERAEGLQLIRIAGVESEMELPYAGLHQLCRPFIRRLDRLPVPQGDALGIALGRQVGDKPDRFLVGLAVLNLLADVAAEQPVLGVVDDAQWLDQASSQTLEFVARRLGSESVGLVFATRDRGQNAQLSGLPELVVAPLSSEAAASLLDFVVPGRLDVAVRDRILAEAHGNPLALLELGRALSLAELTFGSATRAHVAGHSLSSRLERGFMLRMAELPDESRQLLVLAAAEPLGDIPILWRAAEILGLGAEAVMSVEEAGLMELRDRVRFRHPLVRSAVYAAATPAERRRAHEALADVTDPTEDPDRRAWHRARAATGPDEVVAAELQRSADRALARGGLAAAAACLEAAAALTPDRTRRARRSLEAAQAKASAGSFDDALALLAAAEAAALDGADRARVDLLRGQIALHSGHGNEPLPMLISAARQLRPINADLARGTLAEALMAGVFAGRLARGSAGLRQVAEAIREAPLAATPAKVDLLLHGLAQVQTEGYAAGAPALRSAVQMFGSEDLTLDEQLGFAYLAACGASDLFDDANWDLLTATYLEAIRSVGALGLLPLALHSRVIYLVYCGDLIAAELLAAEAAWVANVTAGENSMIPYGSVGLSAIKADKQAEDQIQRAYDHIAARGEGGGLNMVGWLQAVFYNGLGRYAEALDAAQLGAAEPLGIGGPKRALAEWVEAAVRSGNDREAASVLERLTVVTRASGTDLALGIEADRTALVRRDASAEDGYREAIERLARTTIRTEHARAQLHYGEWLRREGRRSEARGQLRAAYESFQGMGVNGFAERARQELAATGENLRKPSAQNRLDALTPHETHIARLAAEGLTNQEIGAELYLSDRTVEWHLRKVFNKLGIRTRRQLPESLLLAGERLRRPNVREPASASN